jgi:putative flippase GtrA
MILKNNIAGYISRFSLVGVVATGVYFIVANFLIGVEMATPANASVLAYISGMVVSFVGQSRFTFRVERNTIGQFARFCVLSLCGMLLSYWCLYATDSLQISPIWGIVFVSMLIPLISFVVMKLWVFDSPPALPEEGR